MSHDSILLQTGDEWKLFVARQLVAVCGRDESDSTVAQTVANYFDSSGGSPNVLVSLESTEVLSDHVPCNARDIRKRLPLLFQFESRLPYAAEQITADFQAVDGGVFGACILTEDIQGLVDQLEDRGISIQSISATTLLALQSLIRNEKIEPNSTVVWWNDSIAEICIFCNGTVNRWMQSTNDPSAIGGTLRGLAKRIGGMESLVVINAPVDFKDSLDDFIGDVTRVESDSIEEHAVAIGTRVLSHSEEPWFEFRRGTLAQADPIRPIRRPLHLTYLATALLLIALTASFWIRARAYDSQADRLRDEESALFSEVFPDARIPAGVLSRLESEHARLAGARGSNRDETATLPFPALTVLNKFLESLSIEERVQFSAVRINDGDLEMDANLKTHGSAGVLVAALQEQGFSVTPPTTEKKDARSVTSLVHGSLRPDNQEQP